MYLNKYLFYKKKYIDLKYNSSNLLGGAPPLDLLPSIYKSYYSGSTYEGEYKKAEVNKSGKRVLNGINAKKFPDGNNGNILKNMPIRIKKLKY